MTKDELVEKCCREYWNSAIDEYHIQPWDKISDVARNGIRKRMGAMIDAVNLMPYQQGTGCGSLNELFD
jgi:hypothetical protein